MHDFIYRYFIKPIITGEGYNIFNTLVYAVGFLLAIYITKLFFNKTKVAINKTWFRSLVLISVVGGLMRASEDWINANYGFMPIRFLLVTPGIYFLLAGIVIFGVLIARERAYSDMDKLNKSLILILGIIILAMGLTTGFHNIIQFIEILALAGTLGYVVTELLKRYNLAQDEDIWIIGGHSLDGSATAIALSSIPGYFEQHVVTGAIISSTNPFMYLAIKITVAAIAVALIKKYMSDEKEWAWIVRLFLVIIGLGPGTRDATRILLGV